MKWRVEKSGGADEGRQPLKSGQGPPGRVLAEGVSLLSVGERGRAPCRRPLPPAKNCRCFTVFCALRIFSPFFGACGFKMGQHGPT